MPSILSNVVVGFDDPIVIMTTDNAWRRVLITAYGAAVVVGTSLAEVLGKPNELRNRGSLFVLVANQPQPALVMAPNSQLFAITVGGAGRLVIESSDPSDVAYDLVS